MIPKSRIIATSLSLEPDRAAVARDLHRAAARGMSRLLVNENMVAHAMVEAQEAGLDIRVSGLVGYPIGQWIWPAKKVAIDELSLLQNGPMVVMHAIGPWLDGTSSSAEEFAGLGALAGEVWLITSLAAIPPDRLGQLADDVAATGASHLILSNGVAASGLPLPDADLIGTFARYVQGRFALVAMVPAGTDTATCATLLAAGADRLACADFWALSAGQDSN